MHHNAEVIAIKSGIIDTILSLILFRGFPLVAGCFLLLACIELAARCLRISIRQEGMHENAEVITTKSGIFDTILSLLCGSFEFCWGCVVLLLCIHLVQQMELGLCDSRTQTVICVLGLGGGTFFGLWFIRQGLGVIFGERDTVIYSRSREIVSWHRTWYLKKKISTYSFDDFNTIWVKWVIKGGFPVRGSGYFLSLTGDRGVNASEENVEIVSNFENQSEAVQFAERIAAMTGLSIQVRN